MTQNLVIVLAILIVEPMSGSAGVIVPPVGYVPESKVTTPIILKYSTDTKFNPYTMSSQSQLAMMLELREHVSVENVG
ncbi:hypothetical protein [Marinomonas aquimarina]|uniref:hypothetical protein n=1 Tax=Marinomonas aquimarina TaxID=295068 RepID=UPI0018D288A1|nr:hypothetical protein [Marinomonas aquimarina]